MFLKKLKMELSYDPAVPLLGIYPEKNMVWKETCPSVFIVTLLVAKTWKQHCPSTEEWIKRMWYMCTMEYYSAVKKNGIMPLAATKMDLESVILSEVSQREVSYDIPYMWNLKWNDTNESHLIYCVFFGEIFIQLFACFSVELSFCLSGTYSLYDLNINPISDVSFTNIFYSVGFFTSLLILMKSSLSVFFLLLVLLLLCLSQCCLNQDCEDIYICFLLRVLQF